VATLYTIGHSTRALIDFLIILRAHEITLLIDVRTVPRSRTNPQFNKDTLPCSLGEAGIRYEHNKALGGLRKATADSLNTGWRNASFRGYADYMSTAEFGEAVRELIALAEEQRTVVMCAESVPWRCHRSLIADAFVAAGHTAVHILSATNANSHKLTSFARVQDGRVWYPGPGDSVSVSK
jgi:uncharacterized protein (DUF488 family)